MSGLITRLLSCLDNGRFKATTRRKLEPKTQLLIIEWRAVALVVRCARAELCQDITADCLLLGFSDAPSSPYTLIPFFVNEG